MADDGDGAPPRAAGDVAILGGPTERGDAVSIVRLREGRVEVGELRAAEEGKPILGEVVKLHPRAEQPRVCDVEVLARPPVAPAAPEPPRKGPAKVSSAAYRAGWDAVFGPRTGGSDLPN